MSFKGGQMSKSVSILIPTRRAFEAIELTLESILMRTWYDNFRIIVCDNSRRQGEGNRYEYLKQHEKNGTIRLIETEIADGSWETRPDGSWLNRYGHGENLKILLKACNTEYAMLLSSGVEILKTDWLDTLIAMLKTDKDLGAARFRPARNNFDTSWVAPCWWPNLMILNMELYRRIMRDEDWNLVRVPYDIYDRKYLFDGQPVPKNPDVEGLTVFCDTGYYLWEWLEYDNPEGYRMINLDTKPAIYQWRWEFNYYIGLDRNSHRPEHPFVQDQRVLIKNRLRILRCQS